MTGIKWVPDTVDVKFDSTRGTLMREGVESIINPPDLNAIELALTLKEKYGGKVSVVTMAPPAAVKGLKMAVAMGADEGILISDKRFGGADTLATSYTIATALRKIGNYELLIFGEETIDSATGHIGPEVGEELNIPHLSYVQEIQIDGNKKTATLVRDIEDGIQVFESELPVLISVGVGINTPRYPIPIRRLMVEINPERYIRTLSFDDLKPDPNRVGLQGSPTRVTKVVAAPLVARKMEIFSFSEEAVELLVKKLKELEGP